MDALFRRFILPNKRGLENAFDRSEQAKASLHGMATLAFKASNNEARHEALVAGLIVAAEIG